MQKNITNTVSIEGIDANTFFAMFTRLEQMIVEVNKVASAEKGDGDLLTRSEVAKMLGVSMPTLHSYINKGLIQSKRIGKNVRIYRSDVHAALIPIRSYSRKNI